MILNKHSKMRPISWLMCLTYVKTCIAQGYRNYPLSYPSWMETYHYPGGYTTPLSTFINGSNIEIPDTYLTPDFRLEEPHFTAYKGFNIETDRPYRLSPHAKTRHYWRLVEQQYLLGCYCCTVYRRLTLLGGCLVITTRHILTTATSTEVILRNYRNERTLEGILGLWYDHDENVYNSSMYATPARIHYHPQYVYDYEVNASHPIPCMYDLALWAATYRFYGSFWNRKGAIICQRAVSSWAQYLDSIPRQDDQWVVVGYQFMKAYNRRPLPWFKYGVRTTKIEAPCPKTEWHWFHCTRGYWAKYGIDSGAGMHFQDRKRTWRIDGAVGIGAFSLNLRSLLNVQYFTVLDTYPVLDFIYYATLAYQKYEYLDGRFDDTKFKAPVLYYGEYIPQDYTYGASYSAYEPPNYRR